VFKAVDPASGADVSGSACGASLQDVSDSNPNVITMASEKRMAW